MNRTKTLVIALWAMFVGQIASAQKGSEDQLIKDATTYFAQGAYLKAFPLYSQLVSLYPNHAEYAFKFGACAIYGDADKTKAVRYLTSAINKSVNDPEVYYFLGKAYHLNYQFKDAITAYENYVRYAGEKAARKEETLRQIETCIYGANLLSNIKDITVISKTETDKSNFFRYFNLEAIGGKILTVPDALKSKEDLKSSTPGVIHYPGNGTTIYFSSYGKNTSNGKDIYKAQVLPDGTFSEAEKLKGGVNTRYDEDFCFMHSDGRTLYFASKGHNSMGGYDIFKSVFDPTTGEFGPSVNLDFAINTPDDDIFYIADSLNQRAYFASGRSSDLDHLNVYNVMVETTPLQVVYLKGVYVSEIDPEQHKVGIKILESTTLRGVCDGGSNSTGDYVVYVPKSGQYTFKVVTENSPTVHEVSVKIPSFDRPVALRQEMRLINENGKERIIVNNYFESPLEEDLSILAAEMLRKKSVLEVNSNDSPTVSLTKTDVKKEDELRTFDQNMANATVAAGFEGGSVSSVVSEMKSELAVIQRFVNESDVKRNNSIAYASKKQKEADALLREAEAIRKTLPTELVTEAHINDLRKMVTLTEQAELVQLDAIAAYNTAKAITTFKESEGKRAEALQASISAISEAEKTQNYDATVAALTVEKDRRTAIRNGVEGSPYDKMIAKSKSLENERAKLEANLTSARESEKAKALQVQRAKEKLANPNVKQSDKATIQNELATAETELASIRRDLIKQQSTFDKSEVTIERAYAEANFFKKVNDDSTAGLEEKDMLTLSSTERDMLEMSIAALDTRVAQLEVTDPQMLAMLGEKTMREYEEPTMTASTSTQTKSATTATTQTQETANQTAAQPAAVTAPSAEATAAANANTTAPASTPVASEASELRSTLDSRMALLETRPNLQIAKALLLRDALLESRERIASLETKLLEGKISPMERSALENLKSLEVIVAQDLASAQGEAPEVSSEEIRTLCNAIDAGYSANLAAIENENTNEIAKAQKRMESKSAMLSQLNKRQLANTRALDNLKLDASDENSFKELERLATEDVTIAAAIESASAVAEHITPLVAAFELENKDIIEGDEDFSLKLQDQLNLGEQYIAALVTFETQLNAKIGTANEAQREQIEIELQAVSEQRQIVEAKQLAYRHDLELTTSAAAPSETAIMNDSASTAKADELNPLAETSIDQSAETITVPENTTTVEDKASVTVNTEVISEESNAEVKSEVKEETQLETEVKVIKDLFASKEEGKSIFAYETGAFEELVIRYPEISARLNNREQIEQLNDEIVLVEGEMEATQGEASLRKMDAKAEQLYLKRSMLEIENAGVVAEMTQQEYRSQLSTSAQEIAAHQEQLNERPQIRNEVARLKSESDMNMQAAEKLREQALPIQDDIEKADYYRQAYALEALAIDQQKQIQSICANLEMLTKYTEPQLAMLKTGTIPTELRPETAVAADSAAVKVNTESNALALAMAENEAVAKKAEVANAVTTPANETSVAPLKAENNAAPISAIGVQNNESAPTISTPVVAESATTPAANETKSEVKPAEVAVVKPTESATADAGATKSNDTPKTEVKTTVAPAPAPSEARAKASANAADYYYSMPSEVIADLFTTTARGVYSNERPIPIDAEMPKGVYYKVQIGAFRNDIPQNLYDQFAPISGERLNTGITRYTAGFFVQFEGAKEVKQQIRAMGYNDAFIVAYKDGKRIPLYEAAAITDGAAIAADIKAAFDKAAVGTNAQNNQAVATTSAASSVKANTDAALNTTSAVSNGTQPEKPAQTAQNAAPATNEAPNAAKATSNATPALNVDAEVANELAKVPAMRTVAEIEAAAAQPKNTEYYNADQTQIAPADQVEKIEGLFYTVQVGVYSKPVAAALLQNVNPLNSELTETNKIRYTTGQFGSLAEAVVKRDETRALGITDAFVTVYYNGKRITLSEADLLLKEKGAGIIAK